MSIFARARESYALTKVWRFDLKATQRSFLHVRSDGMLPLSNRCVYDLLYKIIHLLVY